ARSGSTSWARSRAVSSAPSCTRWSVTTRPPRSPASPSRSARTPKRDPDVSGATPTRPSRRAHMAVKTLPLKKLINTVDAFVTEELQGLEAAHPDLLRIDYSQNVIIRRDAPRKGKVALISGGGSGHEPLHGGYVGLGMLDA